MNFLRGYYPNRTMCNVLKEMRTCQESSNYSPLLGLIHEVQIMGNRMEAGLEDKNDIIEMEKEKHELKQEIKKLRIEKKELEVLVGKVEEE